MSKLDPDNPNVQAAADLVDRLAWEYVTTHTAEELEAAISRSDEQRLIRRQMFRPVPVTPPSESVESARTE